MGDKNLEDFEPQFIPCVESFQEEFDSMVENHLNSCQKCIEDEECSSLELILEAQKIDFVRSYEIPRRNKARRPTLSEISKAIENHFFITGQIRRFN